jgi:hypothetical protein
MKLAFSGQARYTDFSDGYALYLKRSKKGNVLDEAMYRRVVKEYCQTAAERLIEDSMVDLPEIGTITAVSLIRKAQYRGDKFIGYGAKDWKTGRYDGKLKTFGLVLMPKSRRKQNLRCYGFVANRKLFKRMKKIYDSGRHWPLIDFNDKMI